MSTTVVASDLMPALLAIKRAVMSTDQTLLRLPRPSPPKIVDLLTQAQNSLVLAQMAISDMAPPLLQNH